MVEKNKKDELVIEEGMKINGKKIISKVDWKLYFDTNTKKPLGSGYSVYVAGLKEELPTYPNKPPHVKERTAIMLILE